MPSPEFENARRRTVKEQQEFRDYAAADAIVWEPGLGLLLSTKFSDAQRRALGVTLLSVGAVATIPATSDPPRMPTLAESSRRWMCWKAVKARD